MPFVVVRSALTNSKAYYGQIHGTRDTEDVDLTEFATNLLAVRELGVMNPSISNSTSMFSTLWEGTQFLVDYSVCTFFDSVPLQFVFRTLQIGFAKTNLMW